MLKGVKDYLGKPKPPKQFYNTLSHLFCHKVYLDDFQTIIHSMKKDRIFRRTYQKVLSFCILKEYLGEILIYQYPTHF